MTTTPDSEPRDAQHQLFVPSPSTDEDRLARRAALTQCRKTLQALPSEDIFEIPGRPASVFALRDYSKPDTLRELSGRDAARKDVPFLFKAFETGQPRPPQPGSKRAAAPRAFTIHEYLDWTVTAPEPAGLDDLDFGGFRVITLLPRYISLHPPPGALDEEAALVVGEKAKRFAALAAENDGNPSALEKLEAPSPALPVLQTHGTPICAATIRAGPGFLEVPFYATHEAKRSRGHGRALLEAIEAVCRAIGIPVILLCSTDDPKTRATWHRLGFEVSSQSDLEKLGVMHMDLLHMDNTVQMHKRVPPRPTFKSFCIRHQAFHQRAYYIPGSQLPEPPPAPSGYPAKPSKPAKKRPRKRL